MLDSVRARLTLWYAGALLLALVPFSVGGYWLVVRAMEQRTFDALVESSKGFLATLQVEYKNQLKEKADPEALHAAATEAAKEFRLRYQRFAVVDSAGNVLAQNKPLSWPGQSVQDASQPEISAEVLRQLIAGTAGSRLKLQDLALGGEHFRAIVWWDETGSPPLNIVTLRSVEPERLLFAHIRETLFWVLPAMLVIGSIGGYFLARKSLAPVVAMSEQAAHMSAQNLQERLPVQNPRDELGYLASTFNDLLERLNRSFEQQRRFMADASHELRSPVSIIRGEAEVALSRARQPEEYRESLAIALDESRRLSQIVDDLFTMARADAGQYPLHPRDFYLEEMTSECVRAARSIAAASGITLRYQPDGEMPIHADEALVRRLTRNLLDNAIKYTPAGGTVSVACERAGDEYSLTVHDSGPGIPAEAREKIFERFFRLSSARTENRTALETAESASPATAGAGLGLAIARWIAEAHHGRLVLLQSDASGSTFAAFFPANGGATTESTATAHTQREPQTESAKA
jgi:two-component system, OmpR family, sensor kinase